MRVLEVEHLLPLLDVFPDRHLPPVRQVLDRQPRVLRCSPLWWNSHLPPQRRREEPRLEELVLQEIPHLLVP